MCERLLIATVVALTAAIIVRADKGEGTSQYQLVKSDRPALERGEWQLVAESVNGKATSFGPRVIGVRLTFEGATLRQTVDHVRFPEPIVDRFSVVVEDQRRQIDFGHPKDRKYLAIYKLEGDTLILAFSRASRPLDFSPGKGVTVWTLKRVAPSGPSTMPKGIDLP
jgi:uncharacterized protein (TIGR03067 family)